MKNKFDFRLWLTIATIIVGLTYALVLVTPNYWPRDDSGYHWMEFMMRLHSLLFPLGFATLLAFIFGRSKSKSKVMSSKKSQRTVAGLAGLSIIVSYVISAASTHISVFDEVHNKFLYENAGTGFLIAAYILVLLLLNMQNFVFWPLWSKKDKATADERQRTVRNRVFEKTYRYFIVLIAIYWVVSPKIVNTSIDPLRLELVTKYIAVLLLTGLSSIVAAWQKDS